MSAPRAQREVVLLGGGGHALVVAEAALLAGWRLGGFLDDRRDAPLATGSPAAWWLGAIEDGGALRDRDRIVAVGALALRRTLIDRTRDLAGEWATIVHPTAFLSPSATVGAGTFVGAAAVVHTRATVGHHGIINSGAIVEHECVLGENVHVAPGAVLGGTCSVGSDTLIGMGSRVLPGVRIGRGCIVAAGAVVLRDVPDGTKLAGVPATSISRKDA